MIFSINIDQCTNIFILYFSPPDRRLQWPTREFRIPGESNLTCYKFFNVSACEFNI